MRIIILLFISIFSLALELQKPQTYNENKDITSWIMSEKLDGIRGYWDGKTLYTRKGKKINAPKWFIKDFPPFEMDGELWTKREDFENIQNIVMDKIPSKQWEDITYNIFELPNAKGDFFQRLEKLKLWLKKHPNKYIKIIEQKEVKTKENLNAFLENVISNKGEGLVVRDPKMSYHTGRSPYILKIKKALDMEGVVKKINISLKTKVLKSLEIELENGVRFNLGTGFSKEQRENPPKVGTIVTFRYFGFTKKGKPKFASFLHIRKD